MSLRYIREVVVASRDVEESARFHADAFGFENLGGGASGGEVLLGVPGCQGGAVRLVPADVDADSTVDSADEAEVWDLGARLLGIYSHDLDQTVKTMAAAGGAPRQPVTYPYGTASLSELVGRGRDGVWWTVPLAVPGAHRPSLAYAADPERLHSELHSAVLVVDDHDQAVRFFEAGGLTTVFDGTMSGAPFDELVGMPESASLRLAFLFGPEQEAARLEIMSFEGVAGVDRSAQRVGIRRLVFVADDPAATCQALVEAGGEQVAPGLVRGPVGVEIEVVEP